MAARAVLVLGILVLPSLSLAKGGCPRGAYQVDRTQSAGVAGLVIDLQAGTVALPGVCTAVEGRGYGSTYFPDQWFRTVRARWTACDGATDVRSLRARIHYRCRTLRGVFRLANGTRARFRATRVPVCGDGILQPPAEDCEPATETCCTSECRAMPGCSGPCRTDADCAPVAICDWTGTCGITEGSCRVRSGVECSTPGPVCGCDRKTYATYCDAWAARVPVEAAGDCESVCRIDVPGYECTPGKFCEVGGRFCAEKGTGAYGRCEADTDVATCPPFSTPICGCDGETYQNDCHRRAARVQWGLCPGQGP